MRTSQRLFSMLVAILVLPSVCRAAEPSLEAALSALPGYTYGQDRSALTTLEAQVLAVGGRGDEAQRAPLAQRLAKVLADKATTPDARRFICGELGLIGKGEAVPALAAWVGDADMGDAAILALSRIPAPEAGEALRAALGATTGRARMGVITALGDRRDTAAASALVPLAKDADPSTADAAAAALAGIGGDAAGEALRALLAATPAPRPALVGACLAVAETMLHDGKKDAAAGLYRQLYSGSQVSAVRAAALHGLAASGGASLAPELWTALRGDDRQLARVAAENLPRLEGWKPDGGFASQLAGAAPELQVVLLHGLAQRGQPDARPAVLAAAKSNDEAVKIAALEALGTLGDAASVPLLAEALDARATHDAAEGALIALSAPGADEAVLAAAKSAPPARKAGLVAVLGERSSGAAIPDLINLAGTDVDAKVRVAATQSLGRLLPAGRVEDLLALLGKAQGESERDALVDALTSVSRKSEDAEARVAPLLGAYDGLPSPAQASLLRVLGRLGGKRAFAFVDGKRAAGDAALADAAVRALADWPDATPLDALLQIARGDADRSHQVLALRGYVRLLDETEDSAPGLLDRYRAALEAASRDEERRLVIGALARFDSPAALQLVKPQLASPALADDAGVTAIRIMAQMKPADLAGQRQFLRELGDQTQNADVRRGTRNLLRRIP